MIEPIATQNQLGTGAYIATVVWSSYYCTTITSYVGEYALSAEYKSIAQKLNNYKNFLKITLIHLFIHLFITISKKKKKKKKKKTYKIMR